MSLTKEKRPTSQWAPPLQRSTHTALESILLSKDSHKLVNMNQHECEDNINQVCHSMDVATKGDEKAQDLCNASNNASGADVNCGLSIAPPVNIPRSTSQNTVASFDTIMNCPNDCSRGQNSLVGMSFVFLHLFTRMLVFARVDSRTNTDDSGHDVHMMNDICIDELIQGLHSAPKSNTMNGSSSFGTCKTASHWRLAIVSFPMHAS